MSAELGGSQISSLLEALPGIASVLRSPVADALVKAIRAAAGVGEFAFDDAEELVRYAVRRGLIGPEEGDRVIADIEVPLKSKVKPVRAARPKPLVKKKAAKKKSRRGNGRSPLCCWAPPSRALAHRSPRQSRPPTFPRSRARRSSNPRTPPSSFDSGRPSPPPDAATPRAGARARGARSRPTTRSGGGGPARG